MAWSAPIIHAVGDVLTASDWNISSNDLSFLSSVKGTTVAANQSTSSTSYTDLSTVGPTVTLVTGANAIVALTTNLSNSTAPFFSFMGFAVSGATTIAAADTSAAGGQWGDIAPGVSAVCSAVYLVSLTAGSNTFTAKYKAGAGGTASFNNRNIVVWPLP